MLETAKGSCNVHALEDMQLTYIVGSCDDTCHGIDVCQAPLRPPLRAEVIIVITTSVWYS
jgi:hypothetical protein